MNELKATTAQEIVQNEKNCDYMDELFGGVKMPPTQVYLKSDADKVIAEKELNNKIIRINACENWANAEVRYYRALQDNNVCAASFYDIKGQIFVEKPLKPTLYQGDYKPNIPPGFRHPEDWVRLWSRVAEKLHKYRKNLVLQYVYGRNPANVSQYADSVSSEGGV